MARARVGFERLAVGLAALALTYFFFFEYLPPHKKVHLWSDIAGYHYPLQAYAHGALKAGRLPLWDSTIYCGISFVGNVQAALLYPPTWLMYAAAWSWPRIPFKALEILMLLHVWLAFLLGYMWLRGRTGKMASALGAAAFACSGYMMCELLHPGVAAATTWLPLSLWGIDEAVARRDWRPLWKVAASSALSFLAGYPAAWIVCCVVTAAYALFSRGHWRALIGAAVAVGASGLLAAVQLLPALDARSTMHLEPKYGTGAWGWRTLLLSHLLPNWFNFNPGHATSYEPGCFYFYAGLPVLFAILWAVREHKLGPYIQPLAVLVVVFILANPPGILLEAVTRVPALEDTMQPFNFYAGVGPMAALIGAAGLESFLKRGAGRRPLPRWIAPVVAIGLAAWSFHQLRIWVHGGNFPYHGGTIISTAIALALLAAGLWAFRASAGRSRALLGAMVLLLVGTDYKVFGAGRWFNAMAGDADDEYDATGIRGINEPAYQALWSNRNYRIACDEGASPYSTDLRFWGLTTPQGFDPFLPAQYRELIERWVKFRTNRLFFMDFSNDQMLETLGVRYVITHEGSSSQPFLAKSPNFRMVGTTESYYRVYEYAHAKAPYHWADEEQGSARPVVWLPGRRELQVESARGGRFVLAEQFFPGWQALVDGREAGIERWDGAFQAITVPPGPHRLTFEFRPASLRIGAAVSLLALIALLMVVVADSRRRRSATSPRSAPSGVA